MKKHEEGNASVFEQWLESGLLNDSDFDTWTFDSTEYLVLKNRQDDAMENLNSLKGSLLALEGKNKEITKAAGTSSREAEKLHKEVTSLSTTIREVI